MYTSPKTWTEFLGPSFPFPVRLMVHSVGGEAPPPHLTGTNAVESQAALSTAQGEVDAFSSGKGFKITQRRRKERRERNEGDEFCASRQLNFLFRHETSQKTMVGE